SAARFALGSGARFVARSIDTHPNLAEMFHRAHGHRGASFVEIFQNCLVYNDGVFAHFTEKGVAADNQLHVEHAKPLLFGADNDKGLRVKPGTMRVEVVKLGENGITEDDILVHDETDRTVASVLAALDPPEFPVPLGVLFCKPGPSYEEGLAAQRAGDTPADGLKGLNALLRRGHTWNVGG
ncbi:MAG: 2-oxoacid:ferredoxin oxidoreductase subunit beta, partial [Rhodospirillales bacterium]|nr:2-oxoacid:ferredoxin oxidoreductase subunit beta [Rhodospirillales bacterium]